MKNEKVVKTKLNLIQLAHQLHGNDVDDPTMTESESEIGRFLNFIADPSLEKIFCLPTFLEGGKGKYTGGMDAIGLARKLYLKNPHASNDWEAWAKEQFVHREDWPQFINNAKKMTVEKYRLLIVINDPPADRGSWKVNEEDIQLHANDIVGRLKEIVELYERNKFWDTKAAAPEQEPTRDTASAKTDSDAFQIMVEARIDGILSDPATANMSTPDIVIELTALTGLNSLGMMMNDSPLLRRKGTLEDWIRKAKRKKRPGPLKRGPSFS